MATEITTFLMLQPKDSDGFIQNQDISHIIELEEGHDRPYWQWVKHPNKKRGLKLNGVIPENPSTIFQDGLLLLVAAGLGDESMLATLEGRRTGNSKVFDLNLPIGTSFDSLRSGLAKALEGFVVRLVILPGSSLNQIYSGDFEFQLEIAEFTK